MDLLTLFFWFTVASAIIFQVLGERGIVKVGCGTLVYIYLGLGKEKQVFLEPDYALRFGTTRSTYDYDGKEYIIRMDTYMTNQFHENYYRPETDLKQLTELRDYYEKKYD
jgi:hypothetical protein